MKIHKRAIQELFTANDKVFDAEQVLELGRSIPGLTSQNRDIARAPRRRHRSRDEQPRPAVAGRRGGRRPGTPPARAAPGRSRGRCSAPATRGRRSTWSPRLRGTDCRWSAARRSPTTTWSRCRWSGPTSGAATRASIGFRSWVRAFVRSGVPLVFLPGGFHLPTIPAHRKVGTVDLGTADKVAVAALALWFDAAAMRRLRCARHSRWSRSARPSRRSWSCTGDSSSTRRPARAARSGLRSGGAWDGEVAYWRSPLAKDDLFRGGLADLGVHRPGRLSRVAPQARRRPAGGHALRADLPLGSRPGAARDRSA